MEDTMIKRLTLLPILLILINFWACSIPKIKDNKIYFDNKKEIVFQKDEKVLQPKITKPNEAVKYSESVKIIEGWELVVVVREDKYMEGSSISFKILDYKGKLVKQSNKYRVAELFFLVKNKRIVLAGVDYPRTESHCFIFDIKGKLTKEVKITGDVMSVGFLKNPELVYVIHNSGVKEVSGKVPKGAFVNDFDELVLNTIYVFNASGDEIVKYQFDRKQKYEIKHQKKSYSIDLPIPSEL